LTGAWLGVPNRDREEFVREDFRHDENFLCYYAALSGLKFSFTNDNRARHKWRIPQYTKSSIGEQVNSSFRQAPSASRRDAAAGIS
jgi:hypothetical protein